MALTLHRATSLLLTGFILYLQVAPSYQMCKEGNCQSNEAKRIIKACKVKEAKLHQINLDKSKVSSLYAEDIMLTTQDARRFNQQKKCIPTTGRRKKRDILPFGTMSQRKWPMPIKYKLDNSLSGPQMTKIGEAIKWWTDTTCLQFQKVTSSPPGNEQHLVFTKGNQCSSFVGRITEQNPQPIFLHDACFNLLGIPAHEIGHALGMWHEHQRPDRDTHISINYQNVVTGRQGSFEKVRSDLIQLIFNGQKIKYDMSSVMHYGRRVFTTAANKDTIVPKNTQFAKVLGQRVELSFTDAKVMNLAYCSDKCKNSSPLTCKNGGYQDPKNCGKCRCPDGLTGKLCEDVMVTQNCGGIRKATATDQVIRSIGYNDPVKHYQNGDKCSWLIQAPPGNHVEMRFTGTGSNSFGLFEAGGVCYHWVEIRNSVNLDEIGVRYCGKKKPSERDVILSVGDKALVIFRALFLQAASSDMRGFEITYRLSPGCKNNPCLNGGTCNTVTGPTCSCKNGFTGDRCETDIDECKSSPCQNGGSCVDGINSYTCKCPSGFSGARCQTRNNPCGSNPCKNQASCKNNGNSFRCTCAPGFSGPTCETNNPCGSYPCKNHGSCENEGNSFKCTCAPDFTGTTCETKKNECASKPCRNGGTCIDGNNSYDCRCRSGFSGRYCERPTTRCTNTTCKNGGTCGEKPGGGTECQCRPEYSGTHCEKKGKCGGDGAKPGNVVTPCYKKGLCKKTRLVYKIVYTTSYTCTRVRRRVTCGGFWGERAHQCTTFERKCKTKRISRRRCQFVSVNVTCPVPYCKSNAFLIHKWGRVKCGVIGREEKMCPCNVPCGCGVQVRKTYGIKTEPCTRVKYYGPTAIEVKECNTQPCPCRWYGMTERCDSYTFARRDSNNKLTCKCGASYKAFLDRELEIPDPKFPPNCRRHRYWPWGRFDGDHDH